MQAAAYCSPPMRFCWRFCLVYLSCLALAQAQTVVQPASAKPVVDKVVAAVGGQEKLLRLFRMKETFHFGASPVPDAGKKASSRESVVEAPHSWWIGKKERADEPAKYDVWAWTLGILVDTDSEITLLPELKDEGKALFGLRFSGTVSPAMDLYFESGSNLLSRLDWRGDFYRFSDWKDHDGVRYASKTVIYKKASGKPWFYHEVTEIERLAELPQGLVRNAQARP